MLIIKERLKNFSLEFVKFTSLLLFILSVKELGFHLLLSVRHFLSFLNKIDLLSIYKNIEPATLIELNPDFQLGSL